VVVVACGAVRVVEVPAAVVAWIGCGSWRSGTGESKSCTTSTGTQLEVIIILVTYGVFILFIGPGKSLN